MRYFDCTKFDYNKLGQAETEELINRDKQAYSHSLLSWVETEINNIVDRKWQIDNVGIVEETGDFIKLIKESEFSYSLGAYYSSISLVGVASEDLCKYFSKIKNHDDLIDKSQYLRTKGLKDRGVIDNSTFDDFDFIRKIRNDMLHFNEDFKLKDQEEIKEKALICVNKLKGVYKRLFSCFNSEYDKGELIGKVIEDYAKKSAYDPAFGDTLNQEEFAMKLRYFIAEQLELDTAISSPGSTIFQDGIFNVLEIDFDISPKEMTLSHPVSGGVFCVDLTDKNIEEIEKYELKEKDIISAKISSVTNHQGMTAIWRIGSFYIIE